MNIVRNLRNSLLSSILVAFARNAGCLDILIKDLRNWHAGVEFDEEYRDLLLQKFLDFPEFRSLFYYRISRESIFLKTFKIFYPPQAALFICTPDIGPGLYLEHSFATIISARSIGKNCHINQQVTIGHTEKGSPVVGDNVKIFAGAILFGDITIGDNAIIGAGTLVNKSVPPNCTVAGNPARITRFHGSDRAGAPRAMDLS